MEEKDLDMIERYLNGEMSDTELAEFEKRMQEEDGIRLATEETSTLISGIKFAEKKAVLKKLKVIDSAMAHYSPEAKVLPLHKKPMVWGIAASISLIIFAGYFFLLRPGNTNQELFNQYYEAYPNIIAPTMRSTEVEESQKFQAYHAYDLGQFEEAVNLLSQLPTDIDDGGSLLYLGLSHMELGNNDEAIKTFNQYLQSPSELFTPQVRWFLGLAYLKTDRIQEAEAAWAEIPENNSYKAKVRELIERM